MTPDTSVSPRFLCPSCWALFASGGGPACPECAVATPAGGWPSMPCSFRDRYVLTERVGRDATSALFRAESGSGGDPVVLLEVARTSAAGPAAARKLFRREATLAGMLGEETDAFFALSSIDVSDPPYIAFEHVPWPSLREQLAASGPLDAVDAALVGVAILGGLATLERHQVVRQPIVPERVFVARRDDGAFSVKIARFGGKPEGGDDLPSLETLPYASPEALRGEALTSASDVHMVASLLWELVTGQVPFPLQGDVEPAAAARLRLRRLARVPARPATMPGELYDLLATALHPQPSSRGPEGAREGSAVVALGAALQRIAEDAPRRHEVELEEARADLEASARSLAVLSARLAPLRELLDRSAEIEATLARLAADRGSPRAIRAGARSMERAIAALETDMHDVVADTAQALPPSPLARDPLPPPVASEPPPPPVASDPPSPPVASDPPSPPVASDPPQSPPVASDPPPPEVASDPSPRSDPALHQSASHPGAFPPPSRRAPPDSQPAPAATSSPDSMAPKGISIPPDSIEIPGVGGRRWPYAVGVLAVISLAVAAITLVPGLKGPPAPIASASSSAATPASAAAPATVNAPASAKAPASATSPPPESAAPSASAAPTVAPSASAPAPPRAKPPPRRPPPRQEEEPAYQ